MTAQRVHLRHLRPSNARNDSDGDSDGDGDGDSDGDSDGDGGEREERERAFDASKVKGEDRHED